MHCPSSAGDVSHDDACARTPVGPSGGRGPAHAGSDRTPAWWLNLEAAGEGFVEWRGRRQRVRARVVEGEERERRLRRYREVYPAVDEYEAFTDREWPVVVLEPVGD